MVAPKPPSADRSGLPMSAPTQPPAEDSSGRRCAQPGGAPGQRGQAGHGQQGHGRPDDRPGRLRRSGSRPGPPGTPTSRRRPMATATRGTRNRPQPRRSPTPSLAPWPAGPRESGPVEGHARSAPPRVTSTTPHRSVAWLATTAPMVARTPGAPGGPAPAGAGAPAGGSAPPTPTISGATGPRMPDRPFDREAPDRPAGRLVAVVTVRNRLLPQGHRHGDTRSGRSDGDDHRHDHRPLAGPVARPAGPAPCGPPG